MKLWPKLLIVFISVMLVGSSIVVGLTFKTPSGTTAGYADDITSIKCSNNGELYTFTAANLQTALSLSGRIELPEGTVTVSELELENNTILCGQGNSTIIQLANNADNYILNSTGKHDIVIENICFDGNGGNNAGDLYGIFLNSNSYNISIRNCVIRNTRNCGIRAGTQTYNIVVENNFISDVVNTVGKYPGGIMISGYDSIVRNNIIKNTWATGITIEGSVAYPAYNVLVDGNSITGNICNGIHMEGGGVSGNATIVNNMIYDINSTAYLASEGHYSFGMVVQNNSIVKNNHIKNVTNRSINCAGDVVIAGNIIDTVQDASTGYGIYHGSGHGVIEDNIIRDCPYRGIYGTGFELVQNNVVWNCGTAIRSVDVASGNYVYSASSIGFEYVTVATDNYVDGCTSYAFKPLSNSIISGNYVTNTPISAVYCNSRENVSISNNVFLNVATNGGAVGIHLDTACMNCSVVGNIVRGCGGSEIAETDSGDYNLITNNVVDSNGVTKVGANTVEANNLND